MQRVLHGTVPLVIVPSQRCHYAGLSLHRDHSSATDAIGSYMNTLQLAMLAAVLPASIAESIQHTSQYVFVRPLPAWKKKGSLLQQIELRGQPCPFFSMVMVHGLEQLGVYRSLYFLVRWGVPRFLNADSVVQSLYIAGCAQVLDKANHITHLHTPRQIQMYPPQLHRYSYKSNLRPTEIGLVAVPVLLRKVGVALVGVRVGVVLIGYYAKRLRERIDAVHIYCNVSEAPGSVQAMKGTG